MFRSREGLCSECYSPSKAVAERQDKEIDQSRIIVQETSEESLTGEPVWSKG